MTRLFWRSNVYKNFALIVLCTVCAPCFAVSSNEKDCLTLLTKSGNKALPMDQVELLISADLGNRKYPAEMRRDYFRGKKKVVSLSFQIAVHDSNLLRLLILKVENLPDEEREYFADAVAIRLGMVNAEARLTGFPADTNKSELIGFFEVSLGYHHPLTANEAADLFVTINALLASGFGLQRVEDSISHL